MEKTNGAHDDASIKDQRAHVAKSTGAFSVDQHVPPVGAVATIVDEVVQDLAGIGSPAPGKLSLENVQGLIAQECDALKALLLEKNKKYGNSAIEPRRILSKASPVEQIKVRIDDKLKRMENMGTRALPDEDTLQDVIGYFILLRVAQRLGLG